MAEVSKFDVKEFKSILRACRQFGVDEVSVNGCTIKFGSMPREDVGEEADIPSDSLTDDELMFLHTQGVR